MTVIDGLETATNPQTKRLLNVQYSASSMNVVFPFLREWLVSIISPRGASRLPLEHIGLLQPHIAMRRDSDIDTSRNRECSNHRPLVVNTCVRQAQLQPDGIT